jgi:hypothetical protein
VVGGRRIARAFLTRLSVEEDMRLFR